MCVLQHTHTHAQISATVRITESNVSPKYPQEDTVIVSNTIIFDHIPLFHNLLLETFVISLAYRERSQVKHNVFCQTQHAL